jgi:hypothetical protein
MNFQSNANFSEKAFGQMIIRLNDLSANQPFFKFNSGQMTDSRKCWLNDFLKKQNGLKTFLVKIIFRSNGVWSNGDLVK